MNSSYSDQPNRNFDDKLSDEKFFEMLKDDSENTFNEFVYY